MHNEIAPNRADLTYAFKICRGGPADPPSIKTIFLTVGNIKKAQATPLPITIHIASLSCQRQETDISDRDNIKTRDPESKSAKYEKPRTRSRPVPSDPGSRVLVAPIKISGCCHLSNTVWFYPFSPYHCIVMLLKGLPYTRNKTLFWYTTIFFDVCKVTLLMS